MTEIIRHGDTCTIKQAASGKTVEAVVQDFTEKEKLVVILNSDVKLHMRWNGRVYEGKMAGLDFVSNGPKINRTQTGIRG